MNTKKNSPAPGTPDKPSVTPLFHGEIETAQLPGVKLEPNVYLQMRDGIQLAVDIYRPEKEGRYPVLFSMCPYMKEIQQMFPGLSHSIEAGATAFYVRRGYIHVICQARGSGMSQGKWEFLGRQEQEDGYDAIEWIANQPWCDGNVGMIGDSYWAWIQYLVAAQQPPHLKCIVPHDGGTDMYRGSFYKGGIFNQGEFANLWINSSTEQCIWPGQVQGKLPPTNLSADLFAHPEDGPYYWERGAWTMADKIKVPVYFMVPRTPLHSQSQLAFYGEIKAPKRLIVEPEGSFFAHLHFITNRAVNEQVLKWLDYWLKGKDTGIMDEPEVAIFDPVAKEWRYENEYPLKRTQWKKFYFRSDAPTPDIRIIQTQFGMLSQAPPQKETPHKYTYPQHSELLKNGKPVLVYATGPLEKNLRVWGPLSVTLYGSSSAAGTAWFARIFDVGPDNQKRMLTRGILRATFWEVDESRSKPGRPFHTFQNPRPLEPDKIYEFQIEMVPIFHTFKSGHRLWLELASDDMTYFSTLHDIDFQMLPVPCENTIYHDAEHPSHVLLPIVPDAPIIKPVPPPVSEIYWEPELINKRTVIPPDWRLL